MPGPDRFAAWRALLALAFLLLLADRARAYVGPGAGLELGVYALSLLAWVVAAFSAVLLWPVYALLRRIRGGRTQSPAPAGEKVPEEDRAASPADLGPAPLSLQPAPDVERAGKE